MKQIKEDTHEVEIVEAYKDYTPHSSIKPTVKKLIDGIPNSFLSGLKTIVLSNTEKMSRSEKRRKILSRGKKVKHRESLGSYFPQTQTNPAWIKLHIDNIVDRMPGWVLLFSPLRDILIGDTLFHEIGHHIHYTQSPEHKEKEDVAEIWKNKLIRYYFRKHHPIIMIIFFPVSLIYRLIQKIA